MHFSQV